VPLYPAPTPSAESPTSDSRLTQRRRCVGARLFAEFQQQGWVFGEVAGRRSLPDGQMLVQLGALFFTYHAAERSAYGITADIYSHVAAERLSEVFRGEWCYCSRYCSGILEACCLQPNGMSPGENTVGLARFELATPDPQIGPLRVSSANHLSLVSIADR
jgi:hypothetical protein